MSKILIAGDFCPRNRVASLFANNEYSFVLEEARNTISKADYSIVNLECPIVNGSENPIEKYGPNLSCNSYGVQALLYAGFKCVTLANNHFLDFGEEGVNNTIRTLEKYGIDYVGGGQNLVEASKILYKDIKGSKLAIINCCENEFSIATKTTAGSNPLNIVQQFYSIREAQRNADTVILIIHGGHELFQYPSPRMIETYRFFIDAGADIVINHHQHCYSGYEVYKGKPIFYGLGNFCFDLPTKRDGIWTDGYMVMIDLINHSLSFEILPYRQCAEHPRIEILPQDAFNEKLAFINSIIGNPAQLQQKIDDYYNSCSDQYSNIFEPIPGRIYLAAKRRGWLPSFIGKKRKLIANNYIFCESHRDKVMYYLKKK